MKYLFLQLATLFLSVILLLYFFSLDYFIPIRNGAYDWYNIIMVIFLLFLLVESSISTVMYVLEKFLTCGIKEFPDHYRSLKWGVGIAVCLIFSIILSIFNVFPLFYAFFVSVIILIILNIIKIF